MGVFAEPRHPMKEPFPVQNLLPEGVLRDMGEKYLHGLPDVEKNPIGPDFLMHQSDYSWTDYLVAYTLLYPWAVIVLAVVGGIATRAFFVFCRRREYNHRIPCQECGTLMYPCGLNCPKCNTPNPAPCALNWIGYSRLRKKIPAGGRPRQAQSLRSFRRCHFCGEPLHKATLVQQCPACGHPILHGAASVNAYDAYVAGRTHGTYAAVVFLSIIPVVGTLLSSSLYKRTLVNPYALYMNALRESFLLALLFLLRHLFRYVPFIGTFVMPFLCVAEYHLYRRMFLWKADRDGLTAVREQAGH